MVPLLPRTWPSMIDTAALPLQDSELTEAARDAAALLRRHRSAGLMAALQVRVGAGGVDREHWCGPWLQLLDGPTAKTKGVRVTSAG